MRFFSLIGIVLLLFLPGSVFGASKEMQEMQRDIAQLQDQVRTLQSGFDQRMASLTTLVQQALDAANKANTSVNVLNSGVNQTLERELRQSLTPVAGLAVKVDNTNNDVSEVRNSVADLNSQVNKILQVLNDVNAQLKVLQTPAAPPPGGLVPGSPSGTPNAPPPPAATLFDNAVRDQNGGKSDLALSEYSDFLKFYPNDPNAASAQFYVGEIHYAQNKLDLAVQDFDAVIERYSDNTKLTPDAYFMKGMSLKQSAHRDSAATTFRTLIAKFPRSEKAEQAKEQLRAMGFTVTAAPPARRKGR
jgi:TolA-binding protein